MKNTILLTGATGFVGSALTLHLYQQGHSLTAAVRRITDSLPPNIQQAPIGDLLPNTDWTPALHNHNVDTIIHLAARVHVMHDTATDPLTEFRRTNTAATLNLAQQAAAAGVRRFLYLSSIKVNGEITALEQPFTAEETPHSLPLSEEELRDTAVSCSSPDKGRLGGVYSIDPYAISKHEAEIGLRQIAAETGMEVIIIRPPLVYGAGVKGNFHSMMNWLHKGIPLPLGSIHNQRSLVALPNLIDLITTCIDHPAAANQTFLVSDGEDLSTTQLLQRLSHALGKPTHLLPIPQSWLETALTLLGKHAIAQRLCGNLQIDISNTRELLGWNPPVSVDEALRQTAQAYLQARR